MDLALLFEAFRAWYVIRVKKSTKVRFKGEWLNLKKIGFEKNARHRTLGRVLYCESSPHKLYVGMSRAKNKKGKFETWYLISNRGRSGKQMAGEYSRRFGCEEGFRDVKWELGFSQARIEDVRAWSRMFALFAIALLIVVTLSMKLLVKGNKGSFELMRRVASRRKGRWDLSIVSAMTSLLQSDKNLFDHLSINAKFDLDATLINVS